MKRLILAIWFVLLASAASAATVTLLDKSFYVTVTARSFSKFYISGPPINPNRMTWAELGRPDIGPELGVTRLVHVRITADEDYNNESFLLSCDAHGSPLPYVCSNGKYRSGSFDGTTVTFISGSHSTALWMQISRYGGISIFSNDFYLEGTLPDGRPWAIDNGYMLRTEFALVPLPAAFGFLMAALAVMASMAACARRKRRASAYL